MDINLRHLEVSGNTAMVVGSVSVGIVMLFVGVFMLTSLEPIFADRIDQCAFTSYAGTPELVLNETELQSANMSFTIATSSQRGQCILAANLYNITHQTGAYVEIADALDPDNPFVRIDAPETESSTVVTTTASAAGTYVINVTTYGYGNVTMNTTSQLSCCTSLVPTEGPAGRIYNPLVTTTGTIFSVLGLILIVIGLATAIGSLKSLGF